MKKTVIISIAFLVLAGLSFASTVTINVAPNMIPDEEQARVNWGDAPNGFGPDSWQNTEKIKTDDKVNWHARIGQALNVLFPTQAATLKVSDIASISYWTKRPDGTKTGEDWAAFLYTRPSDGEYKVKSSGDDASWYGKRFINNYSAHTNIGDWTQYSTDSGMTFQKNSGTTTGLMSFANLKSTYGNELVEMISVQTMSNYTDFDGYMDGLTITLTDGSVGNVNFIPEPATLALLGLGGLFCRRFKKA